MCSTCGCVCVGLFVVKLLNCNCISVINLIVNVISLVTVLFWSLFTIIRLFYYFFYLLPPSLSLFISLSQIVCVCVFVHFYQSLFLQLFSLRFPMITAIAVIIVYYRLPTILLAARLFLILFICVRSWQSCCLHSHLISNQLLQFAAVAFSNSFLPFSSAIQKCYFNSSYVYYCLPLLLAALSCFYLAAILNVCQLRSLLLCIRCCNQWTDGRMQPELVLFCIVVVSMLLQSLVVFSSWVLYVTIASVCFYVLLSFIRNLHPLTSQHQLLSWYIYYLMYLWRCVCWLVYYDIFHVTYICVCMLVVPFSFCCIFNFIDFSHSLPSTLSFHFRNLFLHGFICVGLPSCFA